MNLGHVPAPEPFTVAKRMPGGDWLRMNSFHILAFSGSGWEQLPVKERNWPDACENRPTASLLLASICTKQTTKTPKILS